MKTVLVSIFAAFLLIAAPSFAQQASKTVGNNWFDASLVPERVQEVAKTAKPGVVLKQARLLWPTDHGLYIVEGSYFGQTWRFRITGNGRLIKASRSR